MSGDSAKEKTKVELENLSRLVDQYAQSRVLPLLIPLAIMILNVVLLLAAGKAAELLIFHLQISEYWFEVIVVGVVVWVVLLCPWVTGKLMARYSDWPYRKEGIIELEEERVPIWAWAAYFITFCGPAFLNLFDILTVRWALVASLISISIFVLYVGKKQNTKLLAGVFAGLMLTAALATVVGVPTPFMNNEEWLFSLFLALMIYVVGAGVLAAVVVHIYNRKVLRKIKQIRPFGEQESNTSDT